MNERYRDFVVSSCEAEGHFAFFEHRQQMWDKIKETVPDNLLLELNALFDRLTKQFATKATYT